jgi:hypothetical protein
VALGFDAHRARGGERVARCVVDRCVDAIVREGTFATTDARDEAFARCARREVREECFALECRPSRAGIRARVVVAGGDECG